MVVLSCKVNPQLQHWSIFLKAPPMLSFLIMLKKVPVQLHPRQLAWYCSAPLCHHWCQDAAVSTVVSILALRGMLLSTDCHSLFAPQSTFVATASKNATLSSSRGQISSGRQHIKIKYLPEGRAVWGRLRTGVTSPFSFFGLPSYHRSFLCVVFILFKLDQPSRTTSADWICGDSGAENWFCHIDPN